MLTNKHERKDMPQMQTFTVTGTLIHKGEVEQITETFSKRPVVVRIEHDKYPQEVKIELVGAAKQHADNLQVGSTVKVSCELTGRAYTRKSDGLQDWFTSVKGFDIFGAGAVETVNVGGIEDVPF